MAKSPESKKQVTYREPDSAFVFRDYGYLRAIDMLYEEFEDDCGILVVYFYGNVCMAKRRANKQ